MANPQGLLAKTEMPNFSILGMLLGGRGYASDWFSTRDKLNLAQAQADTESANRQTSVNTLTGGPEWKAALDNPYDPNALTGLFRRSNQADIDPKTGAVGTGLFESGMANVYGRMNADYSQRLQQENMVQSAKLQIGVDKAKAAQENDLYKQQVTAAFGDDPSMIQTLMQGKLMKDAGLSTETGALPMVTKLPNGQTTIASVPMIGSKEYEERVQPVLAQSQLTGMIDNVVKSFDGGAVMDSASIESLRKQISDAYRIANKAGSNDAGLMQFLDELFPPSFLQGGSWSPVQRNGYQEKWRMAQMVQSAKLKDLKKYTVLPVDVNASPIGGDRPDPRATADRLNQQQGERQKAIAGPQSNPRFGQPRATGGQTGRSSGGSIWNPNAKTRTGGAY